MSKLTGSTVTLMIPLHIVHLFQNATLTLLVCVITMCQDNSKTEEKPEYV